MRVSWGFLRRPKNVHKYERLQMDRSFVGNWGFMRVLEGFWSFESGLERMECTPMRCLRTILSLKSPWWLNLKTAFPWELTQLFLVACQNFLCYKQKNPRDGVLGFGGIAKCLINTAFVKENKLCLKVSIPYHVFGCNPLQCFFPWRRITSLGEGFLGMVLSCSVVKIGI